MAAFTPASEVEGMIVAQAVGLHAASMECLRRAAHPGERSEDVTEFWTRAADLSRAMVEMVEALDRRRALASAPTPQSDPADGPAWSASSMHPCGGVKAAE